MDSDLLLKKLNKDEIDDLKKKIWPLMRKNPIEPMEILPFICNITEVDKEEIKAISKYKGKIAAIDRLHEALTTRNVKCFNSFLTALHDHEYSDLLMKIIELGNNILSNRTSQSSRTRETQMNNTQKSEEQNSYCTEEIPLTAGESGYNNFNISSSPVDSTVRFENVTLGLPRPNDSSSNLEENIQTNLIASSPQSSRNLSESRSSSSSSFNKTPKLENSTDSSKHGIKGVTFTGHNISYGSGKMYGQEEDQQPQIIPTLTSKSKEGTEGCDISPIIRDTQKEIALANKKKELDSSYSETHQMEASEQPLSQTSPKSIFPDEHLKTLENFFMKPSKSTSKRFMGQLSEENMRTSTQVVSQMECSRPRSPLVHQDQNDIANQKGSSLMQGIRDLTNDLEQVGFEKKSNGARPSGSSINIPVQLASTATYVGHPIAAPDSSTNQSSQFDLFQSESGQQSAKNLMGSQQMQGPYRSPVPVSDDSDAKNLEMEASALREDMKNQSNTVGFRDIQNSMPDQCPRSVENMDYHSSVVNQFYYSEVERSQSQGRYNSSSVSINAGESSDRREGSTLGSMSNALSNCPPLNDSLLNEETLTDSNNF